MDKKGRLLKKVTKGYKRLHKQSVKGVSPLRLIPLPDGGQGKIEKGDPCWLMRQVLFKVLFEMLW